MHSVLSQESVWHLKMFCMLWAMQQWVITIRWVQDTSGYGPVVCFYNHASSAGFLSYQSSQSCTGIRASWRGGPRRELRLLDCSSGIRLVCAGLNVLFWASGQMAYACSMMEVHKTDWSMNWTLKDIIRTGSPPRRPIYVAL